MSEENQSENPDIEVTTNSGEIVLDDPHGHIEQVDLQTEMQRSYLDYAMAVIIGRALPDVRDGLKPVHRRVIYAMYDGCANCSRKMKWAACFLPLFRNSPSMRKKATSLF